MIHPDYQAIAIPYPDLILSFLDTHMYKLATAVISLLIISCAAAIF
jgi:hypothetical protein